MMAIAVSQTTVIAGVGGFALLVLFARGIPQEIAKTLSASPALPGGPKDGGAVSRNPGSTGSWAGPSPTPTATSDGGVVSQNPGSTGSWAVPSASNPGFITALGVPTSAAAQNILNAIWANHPAGGYTAPVQGTGNPLITTKPGYPNCYLLPSGQYVGDCGPGYG